MSEGEPAWQGDAFEDVLARAARPEEPRRPARTPLVIASALILIALVLYGMAISAAQAIGENSSDWSPNAPLLLLVGGAAPVISLWKALQGKAVVSTVALLTSVISLLVWWGAQ